MKKLGLIMVAGLIVQTAVFAGAQKDGGAKKETGTQKEFNEKREITVLSREEGSGTRGAFIELFGVETRVNGERIDRTIDEADITNSTQVMMTSVSQNVYAIGYISLGSLNNSVKAVQINGVVPSAANINNKTYPISRPFNIATKGDVSPQAQDFIAYILSAEGQTVVQKNGYISVSNAAPYSGGKPAGKIVVAGSSSVTPVMEKLKEAYLTINPNANIEIQVSDSTMGITSTINGICDIGMSSRDIRDSELAQGLSSTTIALDGIAIIVNQANPVLSLTKEQVCDIYIGNRKTWENAVKK
jgi:phosphate transport system substrate-binding protein